MTKNSRFGHHDTFFCLKSLLTLAAVAVSVPVFAAGTINRVVVSVNNIPYTQLQIERYLDVKECVRENPANATTVQESNWKDAVSSFVRDITIHQEASKSSGFRPSRETVEKLYTRCQTHKDQAGTLQVAFKRLRLEKVSIESELLRVATIENFRKSRATLSQSKQAGGAGWEKEILDRTVVRYFDNALDWIPLEPM